MAIPDYQDLMLPLLKFSSDNAEHKLPEAIEHISKSLNLSDEDKRKLLSSRKQTIISNRAAWALFHLKKAMLLESTRRSYFKITERGLIELKAEPKLINIKYLYKYKEFRDFRAIGKTDQNEIELTHENESLRNIDKKTPIETIENHITELKNTLTEELLNSIKKNEPKFLEKLVLEVLSKMGYGADTEDAILHTGKSGDGGIDGIIKQDKLGLDAIYIQAKKYDNPIHEPALRDFVGALEIQKGIQKGIFITTSTFSNGAREYVKKTSQKIVLIDGYELANLMIKYKIGVTLYDTYEINEINDDYFEE